MLLHSASEYANHFRHYFYRFGAIVRCRLAGGDLIYPNSAFTEVPVRVDGQGRVILSGPLRLGQRSSPSYGRGEILLQAREKSSTVSIGAHSSISNNVVIIARISVSIGSNCLIGDMVSVYDSDFHAISPTQRHSAKGESKEVRIGQNVWLGSRSLVLKGVEIGDNSILAAGAVATKSIPPNVIAAGNPATVVKLLS